MQRRRTQRQGIFKLRKKAKKGRKGQNAYDGLKSMSRAKKKEHGGKKLALVQKKRKAPLT